jgi:tRNA G10  N-methylase Trm11
VAFALQLRKKHGKTPVSTEKNSVSMEKPQSARKNLSGHGKTSVGTEKPQWARKNFNKHGKTSVSMENLL